MTALGKRLSPERADGPQLSSGMPGQPIRLEELAAEAGAIASSRKRPIAAAGWAPTKPVTGLPSRKTLESLGRDVSLC
jgi:hypothetical protein